jgi:plastocyanin
VRRRTAIVAGGHLLAGLVMGSSLVGWSGRVRRKTHEIRMRSDLRGEKVFFDPIGLRVDSGDVVRWVIDANVHTTAAYHPQNAKPRRIPVGATSWDSGYLVNPGDMFETTLGLPGVYDFFCLPHEAAGMVGRIVVGRPPFLPDALPDKAGAITEGALRAFPPVDQIVAQGSVHLF